MFFPEHNNPSKTFFYIFLHEYWSKLKQRNYAHDFNYMYTAL